MNLNDIFTDGSAEFKIKTLALLAYPVGSYYMSSVPTSPAELFGGEREQVKDCFILAAGDEYEVGSTGGEAKHTLTTTEMPAHQHKNRIYNTNNQYFTMATSGIRLVSGTGAYQWVNISTDEDISTAGSTGGDFCGTTTSVGGSQAHNNMPPYLTAYIWHRIA